MVDRWIAVVLVFALLPGVRADDPPAAVERLGTIAHVPIDEASGIAASARFPGVWWVLNDSGGGTALFAIDEIGRVIVPEPARARFHGDKPEPGKTAWPGHQLPGTANVDWEDLVVHDGKVYVADLGNNANARKDLAIYVAAEIDPRTTVDFAGVTTYRVRYPDQEAFPPAAMCFDCESIFVDQGAIYVLTKHRATGKNAPEAGSKLYRLDKPDAAAEVAFALVDRHATIGLWPTAASLSPDGKRLAVLAQTSIWLFERPAEGDRWLSGPAKRLVLEGRVALQAEAICWDGADHLRWCNEQRALYRSPVAAFTDVPAGEKPPAR